MKKTIRSKYIGGIFVNMPYKMLHLYVDDILLAKMCVEIGISASDLEKTDLESFTELADKLKRNGILYTLHGPFWDLCPGSEDPLIRKVAYLRLQQFLDVAQVMDPIHIVLHTGYDPRHHRYQRDLWIDRAISIWLPIIVRARKIGLRVVFENVWEEDPALHKEIFNKLKNFNVGFCLDLGHQNCFSSTKLEVWLKELRDYIAELHIHDNEGEEDSHSPPGSGTINFQYLFAFLSEQKIYPVLNIEPHNEEDFIRTFESLNLIIPKDFLQDYRKALAKMRVRP